MSLSRPSKFEYCYPTITYKIVCIIIHNILIIIYTIMIYRLLSGALPDTGVYWGSRRADIQP